MYNSQDMEANYPSTDKWINKVWYLYAMGYNSAKKKRMKYCICYMMDQEIIMLSKSERERLILYHLHVDSKKIVQMNLLTKQKQTCSIENKFVVTKG